MTEIDSPLHPSAYPVSPINNALMRDANRVVVEMVDDAKTLTGGQLSAAISQYAQALVAEGAASSRVALLARNSVEVLILQSATGLAGACLVPLHPMGSADDHLFAIEDGNVETLIYDPAKFSNRAAELMQRTTRLKNVLALGADELATNLITLAATFEPGPLVPLAAPADGIARLSYSGGTTGKPKAIPGNARSAGQCLQIMLTDWEWPTQPRVLCTVPLSHAGGALFAPTLLKHGTLYVLSVFEPTAVLEAVQRLRINTLMLVPTMIYKLLDHPDFDQYDLSSIEVIYYGASLMSPARLKEGIERLGPVFFQFYGQAEAPMTVMVMRRDEHDPNNPLRLASCGRPVPGVDVALLDDDCAPVADGEPGEICVRGPLVMDGYLERDELNRETFAGGWLHTGDVAVKDADGFMRIVDRKKDMIVSGGFNVFPSEVENVIAEHPAVAEVAVFGTPDPQWGEAVTAAIVLRQGQTVNTEDLVNRVREHKGAICAPKQIHIIDMIPTTPVGKPDKKLLRAQFG